MKIYSPEQQVEHAVKLQQYLTQAPHRDVAKTILKEELERAEGDFDIAIEKALMRQR